MAGVAPGIGYIPVDDPMGCAGCAKKATGDGCETHKGPQREALELAIDRCYGRGDGRGGGAWGALDDEACLGAGVRPGEAARLAQALSSATRAPTFVRAGGDEDLCTYVYVLCVGRVPSLLDVRDERVPVDLVTAGAAAAELGAGEERVRERYLRVALSSVARLATVQEVALELDRGHDGSVEIRELPRAGVYDPILLKRMRAVVDLLNASDVLHVDFGLIDRPLEGADESAYLARFATRPHLVNYLFFAAPVQTASLTLL
jgi:hypothetical protein